MKLNTLVLGCLILVGCSDAPTATQASGRYIVQGASAATLGIKPDRVFNHTIRGFSARLTSEQLETLRASGATIVPDGMVYPDQVEWNLDRIDTRALKLDQAYTPFNTTQGRGVHVYVIDTGIDTTITDFGGRAKWGADLVDGSKQDCYGHGTHVSGTVGSNTYGVAPGVELIAVRIFGCSGGTPSSTVVAAIDWVTANAIRPAVVNMSLGGPMESPDIISEAVQASVNTGITYVVSAGNSASNACLYTPARTPEAITVGASDSYDNMAAYSNGGSCVDLMAPGTVKSWWPGGTTTTMSGTSMSAPHVSGAAAMLLSETPNATPSQVANQILTNATMNVLKNIVIIGTPSLLLYVGDPSIPSPRCKGKGCPKGR